MYLYGQNGRALQLEGDEGTIDTAKKNFGANESGGRHYRSLEHGYTIFTNHLADGCAPVKSHKRCGDDYRQRT